MTVKNIKPVKIPSHCGVITNLSKITTYRAVMPKTRVFFSVAKDIFKLLISFLSQYHNIMIYLPLSKDIFKLISFLNQYHKILIYVPLSKYIFKPLISFLSQYHKIMTYLPLSICLHTSGHNTLTHFFFNVPLDINTLLLLNSKGLGSGVFPVYFSKTIN